MFKSACVCGKRIKITANKQTDLREYCCVIQSFIISGLNTENELRLAGTVMPAINLSMNVFRYAA